MKTIATVLAVGLTAAALSAMSDDDAFLETLAQAGMAEVEAGKIAERQGISAEIREYGAMMVEHHGEANKKLAELAKSKGVALPATAGEDNLASIEALQSQEGARFDQAYVASQVKAHEEAAQLLKSEIANGQDPDAKAFAQELLPTVESHLKAAYHLAGQDERAAASQPQ